MCLWESTQANLAVRTRAAVRAWLINTLNLALATETFQQLYECSNDVNKPGTE